MWVLILCDFLLIYLYFIHTLFYSHFIIILFLFYLKFYFHVVLGRVCAVPAVALPDTRRAAGCRVANCRLDASWKEHDNTLLLLVIIILTIWPRPLLNVRFLRHPTFLSNFPVMVPQESPIELGAVLKYNGRARNLPQAHSFDPNHQGGCRNLPCGTANLGSWVFPKKLPAGGPLLEAE